MKAGAGLRDDAPPPAVRAVGVSRLPCRQVLPSVVAVAVWIGVGAGFGAHLLVSRHSAHRRPLLVSRCGSTARRPGRPVHARRRRSTRCATRTGTLFSLASLHGRTVAIEFFDSHCKQECPLEGRALAAAERSLPVAQRPALVVVSVNPLDTPASTRGRDPGVGACGRGPVALADGHAPAAGAGLGAYHIYVAPGQGRHRSTPRRCTCSIGAADERSGYLYPLRPGPWCAHDLRVTGAQGRDV